MLIFFLAISLRMVPTRFGSIMDPDAFFMFRMARDIVENGYYPTWDNLGWQPNGRSLALEMPLLPFAIAYTYSFLRLMGSKITLESWTILFPALIGSLSVIPIYFIGKAMKDLKTGLIAALLIATIPEYLNRTMGGVADKECLAFPLMLGGFAIVFKLLRERRLEMNILEGLGAGLFFGLVGLAWGGYTYLLLFLSLFYAVAIALELLRIQEIPDPTILGLVLMSISMLLISASIPNWRIDNPFVLIHALSIAGLAGYCALVKATVRMHLLSRRTAVVLFIVLGIGVALFPVYGPALGIVQFRVARKFLTLLNAFETPEVGMHVTVQEYAKPTLTDWLSRYTFYPFLAMVGAGFCLYGRRLEGIFLVLWAGSGFYAGLSAIRSTMLLTPALCVLSAVAVSEWMALVSRERSLRDLEASRSRDAKEAIRKELRLAKIGSPLVALSLLLLMTPSILMGIELVQGRGALLGQGWYDALTWLNRETPVDSILLSWWDYGHWITSVAKRRCVTDGSTTDFQAIQSTALAYLSPEDKAVEIFERYDVQYVIVPEHDFWLVGAFAQIVGNVTDYPDGYYTLNANSTGISWSDLTTKGQNTTIYKLLFAQPDAEKKNFELIHQSYSSGAYGDTSVKIYRVNYPNRES